MTIKFEHLIKQDCITNWFAYLPPWKTQLYLQNEIHEIFHGSPISFNSNFSKASNDSIQEALKTRLEALNSSPVSQALVVYYSLAEAITMGNLEIFDYLASRIDICILTIAIMVDFYFIHTALVLAVILHTPENTVH